MGHKHTSKRAQYPHIVGSGQYPRGGGSVTETGPKDAVPEHYSDAELKRSTAAVYRPNSRSKR